MINVDSKLKQIDRLVDDETITLVSLSRQEHEHFRELIVHLGKCEASCIAYAKERNVMDISFQYLAELEKINR